MNPCIFCKIASGEIASSIVYRDDEVVAFRDLNPQAPTHLLIIPVRHVASLNDAVTGDAALLGRLLMTARALAEKEGVAKAGYRVVMNCGAAGGQSVFHVHLHLLGGRPMSWPPG
jgi:histidine triad (HIT) family protein